MSTYKGPLLEALIKKLEGEIEVELVPKEPPS